MAVTALRIDAGATARAAAAALGEPRRRNPFLYAELQRASFDFDHLLLDVSNGIASARAFDTLEERAQAIAAAIIAAFRGPQGSN